MTLPPLPVTHVVVDGLWEYVQGPYTADQMREYAQAAVLAEREKIAAACDDVFEQRSRDGFVREATTARALAAAIRARG